MLPRDFGIHPPHTHTHTHFQSTIITAYEEHILYWFGTCLAIIVMHETWLHVWTFLVVKHRRHKEICEFQ